MNALSKINKVKLSKYAWGIIRAVLIIGISFLILYPMLVKLSTSFKSHDDMYDPTVYFIPKHFTAGNFITAIQGSNYFVSLLTNIGYVLIISILQVSSCTLVAYGFARFRFPLQKLFFALVVFSLIIPTQAILLPLYLKFRFFNPLQILQFGGTLSGVPLTDTIWPFILLSITAVAYKNGLYIFLLRQHFKNQPVVLEEAAYIDGCNDFKTFIRIMLPGAIPMLITVFLFSFVWTWNDYYYTQLLAPDLPTLSNKLLNITFSSVNSTVADMYASMLQCPKFFLLVGPLVILYLFTQRFFTESIEKSGIVG